MTPYVKSSILNADILGGGGIKAYSVLSNENILTVLA